MDNKEKAKRVVLEEILPSYRKQFGDDIYYSMFTASEIERLIERVAKFEEDKGKPIPVKTDVIEEFRACSYRHLLSVMEQYDHGYEIYGSVNSEKIIQAERCFGYEFPASFKEYLAVFGGMNIGDSYTIGLRDEEDVEDLFWMTKLAQEDHGLPEGFLCLEYDSYLGYTACLDLTCGLGNECPTYWYLFDERRFDGVESINFDIYFRNSVASIIKVNRDNAGLQ